VIERPILDSEPDRTSRSPAQTKPRKCLHDHRVHAKIYNATRRHSTLGMLSPVQFEKINLSPSMKTEDN
jgi:transposase InsO family protein